MQNGRLINNISEPNKQYYVPSLLLSNTMSLAPKIDEVAYAIVSNDIDIAMFTETWPKDSIPDQAIAVAGYRLLRRDRTLKSHGGVCIYVKNSIYCHPLNEFLQRRF